MGQPPTSESDSGTAAPGRTGLGAVLEAMRPPHWIKNAFLAAPLLFSGRFTDPASWALCATAFAAFCLLSSAVYLLNDLRDRPADRMHPTKRLRAIASGRLPARAAWAAAGVLLAGGFALVAAVQADIRPRGHLMGGYALAVWAACYVALNVLYSTWLKKIVVVDVLVVAMGFVLRAMAGAAAIVVPVSPWLVVCTLSLCLFIAVTKRRGEIAELPDGQASWARAVNRSYEPRLVELMLNVSASMAILTYTLYCLAPRTTQRAGSAHMVWTVPLVIYGMFRYYRITSSAAGSDPVRVLVRDRVMWLVLASYVLLCALVLKFASAPAVRDILDFQAS